MVTVIMTVDFFDDGLNKLTGIELLEGLIEVHYVPPSSQQGRQWVDAFVLAVQDADHVPWHSQPHM